MTDNSGHQNPVDQQTVAASPASPSRRRFGKSGIATSGVLFTLASRPVLGQMVCKSPSGFVSGNASTHGPQPVCAGRSPGYWKNHASSWPVPTSTKFSAIFSCNTKSPYAKYTLMQLLTPQQDDVNKLGMHLAAAYLNYMAGWTPFLTEEVLRNMFAQWQVSGFYSPTAGVKWNAQQIVNYLSATQG